MLKTPPIPTKIRADLVEKTDEMLPVVRRKTGREYTRRELIEDLLDRGLQSLARKYLHSTAPRRKDR